MADIRYRFVSTGAESVEQAFQGIDAAARRSARTVERTYASQTRAARVSADAQSRAARAPVSRTEQLAKQVARDQGRAERRALAENERAQKRHYDRVFRMVDQHQRQVIRQAEQSSRAQFQIEQRFAEKARAERAAKFGHIGGALKGAAFGAAATVGALGLGLTGAATRDAFSLQAAANRISISARGAGEKFVDPTTLRREFEATALASGGTVKGEEVADAVQRFITLTGDMDTARRGSNVFSTVATATGGNIGDIAEAAASLSQQFDITGLEDMKDVLAALAFQGKSGAFELKDAASQFQRLAASGAAFGIPKGVTGAKTLGGLTQIARTGTGSAEQASTAVENLLTNLKVKQKLLGQEGVDVYDKSGKVRSVQDLIVESIANVGGTDTAKKNAKLAQIFGEQGIRAINPLVAKYTNTFQGTEGSTKVKMAAAIAVIRKELEDAINAPGSFRDLEIDAAQARKDPAAKIAAKFEQLKAAAADKLMPALAQLIEKIGEAPEAIDAMVGTLQVFLDILSGFVLTLQDLGIIKKRTKTPEQIRDEEKKKADAARDELAHMPNRETYLGMLVDAAKIADPKSRATKLAEAAEYKKTLDPKRESALLSQIALSEKTVGSVSDTIALRESVTSKDSFAKAYAALAATPNDPLQQAFAATAAEDIAKNAMGSKYAKETASVGYNETEEQRKLRASFAQRTAEESIRMGGKSDTGGVEVAMDGLTRAAEATMRALQDAAGAAKKMAEAQNASIITG